MGDFARHITPFYEQRRSDHALDVETPVADVGDDMRAIVGPDVLAFESGRTVWFYKSARERIGPGPTHRRSIGDGIRRPEDALIEQVDAVAPRRRTSLAWIVGPIQNSSG